MVAVNDDVGDRYKLPCKEVRTKVFAFRILLEVV
jgi:hypothetical protein